MSTNLGHPDSTHLHVMLRQLQCPYQLEGNQVLCSFFQREDYCQFSQRSDHNPGTSIPPYICVNYLVGKCTAESTWKVPITDDWLARCSAGYHPTWIQLMELEELNRKVEEVQQDQVQVDVDLKCAICLNKCTRRSAFWSTVVMCSVVSVSSRGRGPITTNHVPSVVSYHDEFSSGLTLLAISKIKLQLFGLQARCIELFLRPNQPGADQRDQVQVDDDQKCAICSQRMHSPLGLLERCCHIFCAQCIVVWQETDLQMCCPVCRVHSRRVLLWSNAEPIKNEQDKLELFRLQDRCIFLFIGLDRELVQQEQEQDELVQPFIITWQEIEQMNRQIAILRERGVPLPWEMD